MRIGEVAVEVGEGNRLPAAGLVDHIHGIRELRFLQCALYRAADAIVRPARRGADDELDGTFGFPACLRGLRPCENRQQSEQHTCIAHYSLLTLF